MRVLSSLADIEFGIGRFRRSGNDLVVESDAQSTLPTTVVMSPRDVWATMAVLLGSGTVLWYVLTLPLRLRRSRQKPAASGGWEARRREVGINKPW